MEDLTEGNPRALAASRRDAAAPSACLSKAALSAQTVPTYPSPVSRLTMLRREQNPGAALILGTISFLKKSRFSSIVAGSMLNGETMSADPGIGGFTTSDTSSSSFST